jgi:predicted DCC family thiol-disulfide oxidoreductase YuxK
MDRLTVLYDELCPICIRCAKWLTTQPSFVTLEVLPSRSAEARQRYGDVPWLGRELVVVSDRGEVWAGAAAFLVSLWALVEWREWSYRLSGPLLAPLAERFFVALSKRRHRLAAWLGPTHCRAGACAVEHPYR